MASKATGLFYFVNFTPNVLLKVNVASFLGLLGDNKALNYIIIVTPVFVLFPDLFCMKPYVCPKWLIFSSALILIVECPGISHTYKPPHHSSNLC